MANRVKEDERNERTIRNLLKLPDNRRCVNCNSLGPQYVCINFWTFICTTCSGIHREFTHRVKSVSMAKFTSQEVSALQGGGNASAKEIYFKEWDLQRHSFPDTSNVERLRDFIKHVYVERRYTGERSFDKPPRVKTGEAENSYERRTDTYQGSRSPPYEDTYERRYSDRTSPGGRSDDSYRNSNDERRSPGYDQESRQYGSDYRRSPARTEIVNDWRREDRFGNGKNSEDGRSSDGSSKLEGRSPDRQKDFHMSSPPVVRPVRDILGDNVSPLRIIEPPKANDGRATDGSLRTQRTTSSSSLTSSNGNPAELKREDSGILIDFDAVPETPIAAMPERQQAATNQSVAQPTTSSLADNWACFDSAPAVKISQASTNENSLESLLSQLSVPTSVPAQTTAFPGVSGVLETAAVPSASNSQGAPVGKMSILPNLTNFPSASAPGAAPAGHTSMFPFEVGARVAAVNSLTPFPSGGVPVGVPGLASGLPSNGVNSFVSVAVEGQWPSMPPIQHSLFPNQSTAQPFNLPVGQSSRNQPWNGSIASNAQGPFGIPEQSLQAFSKPVAEVTSGVVTESSSVEAKPSGRNELPENLFTVTYPSYAPVHGWQTGPPRGLEFNMHYNTAMPTLPFPQPSKSSNPFDFNNEVSPAQAPMFPSMASLHGALPNAAAPGGILHTSSLGTPSPSWTPSQSSYLPAIPTQAPSFASAAHPSAYTGQQVHSNLPSRPQGAGGFSSDGGTLGSIANQQLSGIYSVPSTSNTFSSVSGNPFG